jgi:hypothetical protein
MASLALGGGKGELKDGGAPRTTPCVFSRTLKSIDRRGVELIDRDAAPFVRDLLGAGGPVFRDPGHRVRLALTECRTIDGGCILATYRMS